MQLRRTNCIQIFVCSETSAERRLAGDVTRALPRSRAKVGGKTRSEKRCWQK